MEWQPIATVPRDGRAVLLWSTMSTIEMGQYAKITDAGGEYEDWCLVGQSGASNTGRLMFSHWMPLPAPPDQSDTKEG